ncbi:MAG: tetratricopeptide repeat protein [Tepidisphaeraceae bacterium]|jgi:tetratricopeptide (TPR) repeat protein
MPIAQPTITANEKRLFELRQAEAHYRAVLSQQPNNPDALHLLGMVAYQTNRHAEALGLIRRAIALRPAVADYHCNLGLVYAALGQPNEAMAAYRQCLEIEPTAHEAQYNLGNALRDLMRPAEALTAYQAALKLRPDHVLSLVAVGGVLRTMGRRDEGIAAYQRAIEISPGCIQAHHNLGNAMREQGRTLEAIASFHRALTLEPYSFQTHRQLADAQLAAGMRDEGIRSMGNAVNLCEDRVEPIIRLGGLCHEDGEIGHAADFYRWALDIRPDLASTHVDLALTHLIQGDFARGWREFEWRWRTPELAQRAAALGKPMWNGSDLAGKRILLHAERGFGDTLNFMRYVPLVAARGGTILLACQPEMQPLFQHFADVKEWVRAGEALPPFDVHCSLVSLPAAFGTDLATIPAQIPYVFAEPELSAAWRARLPANDSLKVGLVWSGQVNPLKRFLALSDLAPLAEFTNVWFTSLQKGEAAAELAQAPAGLNITDWTSDLTDFRQTAALIDNLDLVISVDTAVAHLAGAMGKPVWLLLKSVPDWRWMLNRLDSPWYPTMRLFRQTVRGDWQAPVTQVVELLRAKA